MRLAAARLPRRAWSARVRLGGDHARDGARLVTFGEAVSWRRRLSQAAGAVLGQRGNSTSRLEAWAGPAPQAGIGRLVARALGPREAPGGEADLEPAADDATLAALREELAAELARVSREHQHA